MRVLTHASTLSAAMLSIYLFSLHFPSTSGHSPHFYIPIQQRLHWWTDSLGGRVVVVEIDDANCMDIWIGGEGWRKCHWGDNALSIAETTGARVAMPVSFHWWSGDGFIVLGHVVRDGRSIISPNANILRWRRCYFATTWSGQFIIGETDQTTGKLLQSLPQVRHLVGGGGWLVRDANAHAWRLAQIQGFRTDITHSHRERTVVAVNANGTTAWLIVFTGRVSLQDCAVWLTNKLPVHHAIFFDGGRNTALVMRVDDTDAFQVHSASLPLPDIPCALIVQ